MANRATNIFESGIKKILVIDDNATIRKMLMATLTMSGYLVDSACNGEEGLTKLREKNYSVAILDYDMPKLNGLGLYRRVCEEALSIKNHIIFYTANDCEALQGYLTKANVPYLTKPAPFQKLNEYINEYSVK